MLGSALRAITYSNIWIAAGSSAFTLLFYWAFSIPIDLYLLSFIFCATLFTYTFQRVVKLRSKERINGPRMDWMRENKSTVNFILISSIAGTALFSFFLRRDTLITLIAMGMISLLYAVKINMGFGVKTNLRDISGIKIVLIALVWSASCAVLPAIQAGCWNKEVMIFALAVSVFIVGITIPFDIRDLEVDEQEKKTIPQILGLNKSKFVGIVCVGFAYFLMSYQGNLYALFLFPGIIASGVLIVLSDKNRSELYFSGLIDGMLLFMPASYYLLKIL